MIPSLLALGLTADPMPLERQPDGRVVVRVEAQQRSGSWKTLRLLLDTGASTVVLDRAVAEDLVLPAFKEVRMGGVSGATRPALLRSLRALRAGGVTQPRVTVTVTDLHAMRRWWDDPVDGLLGMSFLADRTFTVDAPAGQWSWGLNAPVSLWWSFTPVARDLRPYADMNVWGTPQSMLLDTGASGTLWGVPDKALLERRTECDLVAGTTGLMRLPVGYGAPTLFGQLQVGTRLNAGGSTLILGASFLLAAPVHFDFVRNRVGLTLDAQGRVCRGPAFAQGSIPIAWNRRGPAAFLEVVDVPRCHPWYLAGFREGDVIQSMGDDAAKDLSLLRISEALRGGTTRTWTVGRKKTSLRLINPPLPELPWFLPSEIGSTKP